jgi:hypothetical protein
MVMATPGKVAEFYANKKAACGRLAIIQPRVCVAAVTDALATFSVSAGLDRRFMSVFGLPADRGALSGSIPGIKYLDN